MRLRRSAVVSALVTSLMVATFGMAGTAGAERYFGIEQEDEREGEFFRTNLRGSNEVPGPGDPSAFGVALVSVDPSDNTICYWLRVAGIEPATAAHIHIGDEDSAGPVVQGLTPPTSGSSEGCVSASAELVDNILDDPDNYYVNVHNAEYPAGAVRGQLD